MNKERKRHTGMPSFHLRSKRNSLQVPNICKNVRRASLCAFQKGSLTLEASIVLPFLLCAITAMLYVFTFTYIQARSYRTLGEKAERMAVTAGRTMSGEPYIRMYDSTRAALPFEAWFQEKRIAVQEVKVRAWVGYTGESFQDAVTEQLVYMTPEGTVCHRRRECTYLYLSVRRISSQNLEDARNMSGAKYTACEYCVKKGWTGFSVYITDYGTSYHTVNTCQGLRRTIMAVPWSQAGGRPICSRCGGS